jgi:hypothetical protein
MTIFKTGFVAACASFTLLSAAVAAPLPAPGVVFPAGTDFTDPVHGGGQLIMNDNAITFRMDPTPASPLTDVGGRVQNRVTRQVDGSLNFLPRIRDTFNIDGGTFGITGFQLEGFGNFDVDVEYRTDGSGDKGPTSVSRSNSGDLMTFRYDDPLFIDAIAPSFQQESYFPSIATEAEHFDLSGSMTIFGQLFLIDFGTPPQPGGDLISVTINGIAVPTTAPIPLPAPVAMLGFGLLALGGLRRLRK